MFLQVSFTFLLSLVLASALPTSDDEYQTFSRELQTLQQEFSKRDFWEGLWKAGSRICKIAKTLSLDNNADNANNANNATEVDPVQVQKRDFWNNLLTVVNKVCKAASETERDITSGLDPEVADDKRDFWEDLGNVGKKVCQVADTLANNGRRSGKYVEQDPELRRKRFFWPDLVTTVDQICKAAGR
uniref:Uncharacterized protein n=1 Tax=Biomphalaria glabrata TaxID=6526 RepID=A0A2C9L844_BIOGL